MENREDILKKIDKLLALGGNNPNKNEAISAVAKAQELMVKYNIELADVQEAEAGQKIGKEIYSPKKSSHYVSKWKYTLSQIIAKNFCCKTYSLGRDAIVFYGYEKDAKIAQHVFGFLFETGNKLADKYYRKCKKKGKETKGILNTYLTGFCAGIKEVLDKQSTALMVIVPEEVEESYQEYSKGFRQISNKLITSNDGRAYQDGRLEGRQTVMAREIEG